MIDTMLLDIASLISVFGHFFIMYLILPFRNSAKFSFATFSIFTVALFASSYLLGLEITVVTNFFRGVIYLPLCIWLFRGQLYQKVFAFFQNFLLTAFQAALSLEIARYIVPFGSENYILSFLIIYVIMFSLYLALLFRFWQRIFRKLFIDGNRTEWGLYSLGVIFSYAALTMLRITLETGVVYSVLLLFVMWSFCMLCFAIINTHEKTKQQSDAEFLRGIVSGGRDHYRKMDEMYDRLRVLRHDYKYHLNTARNLLGLGDAVGASEYLSEVERQLAETEMPHYCSNTVINALIAGYSERCEDAEIQFSAHLNNISEQLGIPDYDMCIILGNLLENAIEACEGLCGGKLVVETESTGVQLLVMVRNSFDGSIRTENGIPVSAKANGGFGLRSVKEVIARHGGNFSVEWNESTFSAYVAVKL